MDFYQQQELARKASRRMVWLYGVAVVGIAVAMHVALSVFLALGLCLDEEAEREFGAEFLDLLLAPRFAAVTILGTVALIGITSLVKIWRLSSGGAAVAKSMGGREVSLQTRDFKERRLLNVVEEMAIASGVPMPRVFVLAGEKGSNAFAAGFKSKDAAVAVTQGLLNTLNREELQAVIAHEFSHILNGDMRLNVRLIGTLHGIFALTILAMVVWRIAQAVASSKSSSRRDDKDSGGGKLAVVLALLLLGLLIWLIGHIGYFLGRLIQSSVSRHREVLADASAVQFTRNPLGLANALKLIGAEGSRLASPKTMEVSHMLFASGLKSMFATHPPLVQRIQQWDPSFNGDFEEASKLLLKRDAAARQEAATEAATTETATTEATSVEAIFTGMGDAEQDASLRSIGAVVATLGRLTDDDRTTLHESRAAMACICGCLFSEDAAVQERQRTILSQGFPNDEGIATACMGWAKRAEAWTLRERRTACEIAVNGLRGNRGALHQQFCAVVTELIKADGMMSPFEFAVTCMVRRRLQDGTPSTPSARDADATFPAAASRVLSVVAYEFEDKSPEEFQRLWDAGVKHMAEACDLPNEPSLRDGGGLRPSSLAPCAIETVQDMEAFDAALTVIEGVAPLVKRTFMEACTAVAEADGTVTDTQDTLLFAIADAIDAPRPSSLA
ncbi:MAG: M48 family metallopeptidase [Kiritimatiellaeota bacterium]|nr:M48 family metallopeptidase [Kiritimatiellota bacterium]